TLRVCRCVQSANRLGFPGCHRNRRGHYAGNGGKPAQRLCLAEFHASPRGPTRIAARRFCAGETGVFRSPHVGCVGALTGDKVRGNSLAGFWSRNDRDGAMRNCILLAAILPAWVVVPLRSAQQVEIPEWAYPVNPPVSVSTAAVTDDGTLQHVPGSTHAFTRKQLSDIG